MKLTDQDIRDILDFVLGRIANIADIEYQKRVWIRGEGPEVDDFDETVNNFFGDGEPIVENYRDYGLSQNQYIPLKKFYDEFSFFAYENDFPEEFIDTPEWGKIMELAKEVLKAFNYHKPYKITEK